MESWPLLEENPWSLDTDISWIEEKEVWPNYTNPQKANEYPEWFLQIKPDPCPDITAIVLPYIEFEDIFEKEFTIRSFLTSSLERITCIKSYKV
ncbi:hypothetical protein O181_123758 [Austropuccinia psidii MF-1]|uniref:Uncharacterized protein n=1 Tax=Austropuccinia psidii MF-1 TaxID=1389203 RepID=A0A9Q3Q3F6_9BASI|nr:hypothetical protein [Austropuccinia psidii MF-1]